MAKLAPIPADRAEARPRPDALRRAALPHEDPDELEARVRAWVDDCAPADAVERALVDRAARLSWALDRAERAEAASLARRVRRATLRSRALRTARVCDLGRKLLYMPGRRLAPGSGPGWSDDPAAFVAALEESAEGARWLLDRWEELRSLILADQLWTYLDQYKFIRLLGKQPFDAIDDPELNAIFLAWEAVEEGWGVRFWRKVQESTPYQDPAFSAWRLWREIAPRPADALAGVAQLRGVAEREAARLRARIAVLEEVEGGDARELAEAASFAPGNAAERLRRHKTSLARELIKTVETLAKLRKDAARPEPRTKAAPKPAKAEGDPRPETTVPEAGLIPSPVVASARLRVVDPSGEGGAASAQEKGPRGAGRAPRARKVGVS